MRASAWFPPVPSSVTDARHWLIDQLRQHDLDVLVPDAELCLSELAANAVRHAGTEFEIEVTCAERAGLLRLAVRDQSDVRPRPRAAGPFEVSGRGLQIVTAVATDWGVTEHVPVGKTVWCTIAGPGLDQVESDGAGVH